EIDKQTIKQYSDVPPDDIIRYAAYACRIENQDAMPTVLSVTLAIGAQQLSQHKAIVTHITAIEELAAVSILCSDKTGTLTLNKLEIDKQTIKQYSDVPPDDIIRYAAYACRIENQDAM
ncbi:unnamed protein product, partial [Didymodactylos carnosus]